MVGVSYSQMSAPYPLLGLQSDCVCAYLLLFPEQGSVWTDADPLRAAYTLLGLWHCIAWALTKSIFEGASQQENMGAGQVVLARFAPVFCGWELEQRPGWKGHINRECGAGYTVNKLGSKCQHFAGSHRYKCVLGWGLGEGNVSY